VWNVVLEKVQMAGMKRNGLSSKWSAWRIPTSPSMRLKVYDRPDWTLFVKMYERFTNLNK